MKQNTYKGFKMPFIGRPSNGKRKDKNDPAVIRFLRDMNYSNAETLNWFNGCRITIKYETKKAFYVFIRGDIWGKIYQIIKS